MIPAYCTISWTSVHSSPGTLSDLIPCIYLLLPLYNCKGFDLSHTWWASFPYFLQFKSEFGNKEFMIWATVSSQFCFCWLYRASPSLAAKNIINLISVLTMMVNISWRIWWQCPCVESSLVLLEEGVCYDQCVLLAKLCSLLPCFSLYSKTKFSHYSRYFLTSYFCIPVPYNEKDIFWGVLVLEDLVGLHRNVQLQLLQRYWLGHRLGLLWYWMVCLGSEQISFCCFWNCIQVLHFGVLLTMMATPFLLRDSCSQ